MLTVVDDNTGEEVEVQIAEMTAAMASVVSLSRELPRDAASRIEQAMAAAVRNAMEAGVTAPEDIRKAMLNARSSTRIALLNEMRDLRSQEAAAQEK